MKQRGELGRLLRYVKPYRMRLAAGIVSLGFVGLAEGLVAPGRLAEHTIGIEEVRALAQAFAPEQVAEVCGITAVEIRALARGSSAIVSRLTCGQVQLADAIPLPSRFRTQE